MEDKAKSKDVSEEILETLNSVDKELSEVFYELMGNNISLKKRMLLREKTILLIRKVYESLSTGVNKTEKELEDYDICYSKYKKLSNISFVIRIIGMLFLFLKPYLSLTLQLIAIFMQHHAVKKMSNFNEPKVDLSKEVVEKGNSLSILIGNCTRRLSLDVEVYSDKEDEELFNKMDDANNIINEYVKTNVMPQQVDEITKEILVKMLKKDLKIENDNIEYLLDAARNKIKEEEIKENISKKLTN